MIESWAICDRCGYREKARIHKTECKPVHPNEWQSHAVVRDQGNSTDGILNIMVCLNCVSERNALLASWYPLKKDN